MNSDLTIMIKANAAAVATYEADVAAIVKSTIDTEYETAMAALSKYISNGDEARFTNYRFNPWQDDLGNDKVRKAARMAFAAKFKADLAVLSANSKVEALAVKISPNTFIHNAYTRTYTRTVIRSLAAIKKKQQQIKKNIINAELQIAEASSRAKAAFEKYNKADLAAKEARYKAILSVYNIKDTPASRKANYDTFKTSFDNALYIYRHPYENGTVRKFRKAHTIIFAKLDHVYSARENADCNYCSADERAGRERNKAYDFKVKAKVIAVLIDAIKSIATTLNYRT